MRTLHLSRRTLRTLLPLLVTALAACQGAQQKFDDATRAYDAENWSKAYEDATAAQNEAQPPLKQRAALYAGQAAFRMKRLDDAQARLTVAETSPEAEVAGQAKMMLGHVLVDANRPGDAKLKYLEAAQLLPPTMAAEARREADAAGALANPPAASTAVASADSAEDDTAPAPPSNSKGSSARKPAPKSGAKSGDGAKGKGGAKDDDKSKTKDAKGKGDAAKSDAGKSSGSKSAAGKSDDTKGGFTIQVGAYAKEADARKRAKDLTDDAKKAGLPAPKVNRVTGRDGKKLWVVTIGQFKSRADGKKALAKLKIDHAEVLPDTN